MRAHANFRFLALVCLTAASFSLQATPSLTQGETLHQNKCAACHNAKSGLGNGDIFYTRSDRKVKSLAKLRSQVSLCNSTLSLELFPEDEADVVAFLNQRFYHFK